MEPDIGSEPNARVSLTLKKEVVGKMPGAAVFLSLQFQEYNDGEVNTKHAHKKRGDVSSHIHLRYFEGYTKSSILTLDVSQYLLSSPPSCSSLLPFMNHP